MAAIAASTKNAAAAIRFVIGSGVYRYLASTPEHRHRQECLCHTGAAGKACESFREGAAPDGLHCLMLLTQAGVAQTLLSVLGQGAAADIANSGLAERRSRRRS